MNRELLQFVMFGGTSLAYENGATEPSEPSNDTGPKDPPSDQSTYQDPNDDEDVLDEDSPNEPDNDGTRTLPTANATFWYMCSEKEADADEKNLRF